MLKRNFSDWPVACLAALFMVLVACPASTPPPSNQPSRVQQLDQRYGHVLRFGKTFHTSAMIQAGRMHASGTLTDEQLDQVREYESKFHIAWDASQRTLAAAMRLQTRNAEADFYAYFAEFSRLLFEFQELAAKLGVKP